MRLRVAGVFGFMALVGAAGGLVSAKHIPTWQGLLAIALFIVGAISLVAPFQVASKLQKEHPIERMRTSPLDSSQTALAPTDARLQEKNHHDATKLTLIVVSMIPCAYMLACQLRLPSSNMWAIGIVYVLLIAQLMLVRGILWRIARYPLRFEFVADAEGLNIRLVKLQSKHLTWHEIQEASLVEEFDDSGERLSLCLVLVFVNKRISSYSISLSQFEAEDAARFQSVVARYLKPPSAS